MAAAKAPEAQIKTVRASAAAANDEAAAATCFDALITAAGQLVPELLLATQDAAAAHQPPLLPALPAPLVVCGPFGTGKSELLQLLMDSLPGRFGVPAVHTTTQQPGSGEDSTAAANRWADSQCSTGACMLDATAGINETACSCQQVHWSGSKSPSVTATR